MNLQPAACLAAVSLLAGCSHSPISAFSGDDKSAFERKIMCISAAERTLKTRGTWYVDDEKTYIYESFFSSKRDSCVAVLVATYGEFTSLPSGESANTLSDTYDIIDTLTYERIGHKVSGSGSDRTRANEEIEKLVVDLKSAK